jgi:hypothetical protein
MAEGSDGGTGSARRRGRHAAPPARTRSLRRPGAESVVGLRATVSSMGPRVVATIRPRVAVAVAWVIERRLRVIVAGTAVAVVALFGGTFMLLQPTDASSPADDAAPPANPREVADHPLGPSTLAPETPALHVDQTPQATQADGDPPSAGEDPEAGADPGGATSEPSPEPSPTQTSEPTTEPTTEPSSGNGRATAPGQLKRPEKPTG